MPILKGATGLRQPVHASNVADALLAICRIDSMDSILEIGGPEKIAVSAMLEIVSNAVGVRSLIIPVPRFAIALMSTVSRLVDAPMIAALARSVEDQCVEKNAMEELNVAPIFLDQSSIHRAVQLGQRLA
jgi:nucleoside-diphosphate-sugar epimerase